MQFGSVTVWFFHRWVRHVVDVKFRTVSKGVMVPYLGKKIDHFLSPSCLVLANSILVWRRERVRVAKVCA